MNTKWGDGRRTRLAGYVSLSLVVLVGALILMAASGAFAVGPDVAIVLVLIEAIAVLFLAAWAWKVRRDRRP